MGIFFLEGGSIKFQLFLGGYALIPDMFFWCENSRCCVQAYVSGEIENTHTPGVMSVRRQFANNAETKKKHLGIF